MKSYSEAKVFTRQELDFLATAQRLVQLLPSHDEGGEWLRCHELVRAVGAVMGLTHQDGHYGMVEHSWLWTTEFAPFSQPPNILDVYCPGRVPQVQLIHSSTFLPYEYRRGNLRDDLREDVIIEMRRQMTR